MIEDMKFTTDWVTWRCDWWRELLAPEIGQPVRMLEVGFFEGRSAQWWLQNVLTHPAAKLVCVDRWAKKGASNRVEIQTDPAYPNKFSYFAEDAILWAARLIGDGAGECFDVVYSDFSKEAADILTLACLAFRLLKPGGLYLFDDYEWVWTETSCMAKPALGPKAGIDAWLAAHDPFVEDVRWNKGQVAVRKRMRP